MKKLLAILLGAIICINLLVSVNAERFFVCTDDHAGFDVSVIEDWYSEASDFVRNYNLIFDVLVYADNYLYNDRPFDYYYDFCGNRDVTRSEVAMMLSMYNCSITIPWDLHRYSVETWYTDPENPTFVDVPNGMLYTSSAQWAYDNGIVNGVGGAYFAPDRTITREEFATMLYRYTNYLEVDTSARADFSAFADGDSVSVWATDAMSWAVAEGLISGKPGDLLAPKDTITRAEVAVIVYRYNNEVKAHRDILDGN